jgi:hypothetical protein
VRLGPRAAAAAAAAAAAPPRAAPAAASSSSSSSSGPSGRSEGPAPTTVRSVSVSHAMTEICGSRASVRSDVLSAIATAVAVVATLTLLPPAPPSATIEPASEDAGIAVPATLERSAPGAASTQR